MVIFEPAIEIALICVVLALVSKAIQRKFIDKALMKEYKDEIKKIQKKLQKDIKEGKTEKAAELQKQMFEVQGKMLKGTNKVMMFSLPIFLVAFGILGFLYGGISFESLFPLPKFAGFMIWNPMSWIPVGVTTTTGYYKAYFFYYFVLTIALNIIEKIYDKKK